jgi:hypothetical protein
MNLLHSLRERVSGPDLLTLGLMSLAAPWIAAYIHSACVFHRGIRLYNAEIGGTFFRDSTQSGWGTILMWVGLCAIPAMPTLLLLLALRKRVALRWLAWFCCIALWTWMCFKMEVAYH